MKQKPKRTIKRSFVNSLGALGYFFGTLQWFWMVVLYFSVVQSAIPFLYPDINTPVTKHVTTPTFAVPGSIETIIFASVVIIMLGITIYAFIKIPATFVKTSQKAIHKTSESAIPIIAKAQHKKDTHTLRIKLTPKLVIISKAMFVFIPALLIALSPKLLAAPPINYTISLVIGFGLAGISTGCFSIQYLSAFWLRVKQSDLW